MKNLLQILKTDLSEQKNESANKDRTKEIINHEDKKEKKLEKREQSLQGLCVTTGLTCVHTQEQRRRRRAGGHTCLTDAVRFCQLKVCSDPASSKLTGTTLPTSLAPFMSLCHILFFYHLETFHIYRTFHLKAEYALLSRAHRTLSRIDHMCQRSPCSRVHSL